MLWILKEKTEICKILFFHEKDYVNKKQTEINVKNIFDKQVF